MTQMPTRQTEFPMDPEGPRNINRRYILVAAILLVIILVAAILLLVFGLPALRRAGEPTAVPTVASPPTSVPTFTAGPTTPTSRPPTPTLVPSPAPTEAELLMLNTDTPTFELVSAGARPSTEWTGFFGQVLDASGSPLAGVPVVVWYDDPEGRLAGGPVVTDAEGMYEVQIAQAPFRGTWSIQLLTADYQPASKLFTFATDEDTAQGVQQIQVIWQQVGP